MKYTLFVGGVEVNDYLMSKQEAEQLKEEYASYDDVKIVEVEE